MLIDEVIELLRAELSLVYDGTPAEFGPLVYKNGLLRKLIQKMKEHNEQSR